jgi:hypothetical protein
MNWCEHCLNLLSTLIGAGVGVWGAFQIYRCQVKNDIQKAKDQKISNEQDFLDYYSLLLTDFKETVVNELENIQDFVDKQKQELSEVKSIYSTPKESFIRLKTIDHSQLFNAWSDLITDKDKILKYRRLQTMIDFIREKFDEIDGIYERTGSIVMNYLNHLNTNMLMFDLRLDNFLIEYKKSNNIAGNINYIEVTQLFEKHLKQRQNIIQKETRENHQTYTEIKQEFLEPLRKSFAAWIEIPSPLIELLASIMNDLQQIELQIKDMLRIMIISQKEIEKYLPDIEEYFKLTKAYKLSKTQNES